MTLKEFKQSLTNDEPENQLGNLLAALWWDAKGDWDRAHGIVQNLESNEAKWIHAYLHRIEGDLNNSRYWYSAAGRDVPTKSLEAEWESIASALLAQHE